MVTNKQTTGRPNSQGELMMLANAWLVELLTANKTKCLLVSVSQ